jgi:hypothetical protein
MKINKMQNKIKVKYYRFSTGKEDEMGRVCSMYGKIYGWKV